MLRKARFRKKGEEKEFWKIWFRGPKNMTFTKPSMKLFYQDMIQFIPDKRYHPGRKNDFPHFMSRKRDV
jgi:hypothetical protein